MSDEERKAIDNMKSLLLYSKEHEYFSPFQEQEIDDMNIVLNIVEKQSKEIEELQENYSSAHKDINWFCENYISKVESEQRERKAYIKGTNVADELCNKKWKDKIKAKIEEVEIKLKDYGADKINIFSGQTYMEKFRLLGALYVLQSFLEEKE